MPNYTERTVISKPRDFNQVANNAGSGGVVNNNVTETITFDTLDIPESAEYVWEMRLKSMRNESGTSIINDYAVSYLLSNN